MIKKYKKNQNDKKNSTIYYYFNYFMWKKAAQNIRKVSIYILIKNNLMKYKKRYFYIGMLVPKEYAKKFITSSYVYSYDKIKNNINNFKKTLKNKSFNLFFSKSNSGKNLELN